MLAINYYCEERKIELLSNIYMVLYKNVKIFS